MELQLCLSLPTLRINGCNNSSTTSPPPITTRGSGIDDLAFSFLDLNSTTSATSSSSSSSPCDYRSDRSTFDDLINSNNMKRKRESDDDVDSGSSQFRCRTLPLLNWNKRTDEHDDCDHIRNRLKYATINLRDGEGGGDNVVGWPPIKSYRRNEFGYHHNRRSAVFRDYMPVENREADTAGSHLSNSLYVKAQIEGILITRKIDLCQHRSYEGLISSLLTLFGRGRECAQRYNLAYVDNDGDWLLTGDVPWREFIQSVHRLKLLRNSSN